MRWRQRTGLEGGVGVGGLSVDKQYCSSEEWIGIRAWWWWWWLENFKAI